ncbi:TadA family conjugal transfer-associated ATPase [Sanguibacter sp. HDW7]|uniref:TadA family conjugal transfer-associated ATPase n=1 Tax=Sanguibacter sp. HDW7 TaxID=2714931 RepID=UPI0014092FCD|nr:TadA family conjugal transfer-associated ATPase [Sanguibacter sp. HDW7]QIK84452.1 TadA family conjugal transfer-associated ATPase [Sanguibacter sp. HDW7]
MRTYDDALLADVRARLATVPAGVADLGDVVRDAVRHRGVVLGSHALERLVHDVRDATLGAGPLQVLLDEPGVTDVLVNGPRDVWVDRGSGLEHVPLDLGTDDDVRALAVHLAAAGGQRLDDASPVVDARLPDGARLHAVVAPVCPRGALISLRVLRPGGLPYTELVAAGMLPPGTGDLLPALVAARANVLVSGSTGTGKTTLLAALLALAPPDERLLVVEEARELVPTHPHVLHLLARRANVEGRGEVTLADLVRATLRMRPDRIVLGECRGAEVRELLTALNTGHDGGWATLHANSAADVPARLMALGALAGLDPAAVAAQAAAALDVVVHLRRTDGRRHVAEVGTVGLDDGRLVVEPALTWDGSGAPVRGPAWDALVAQLRDRA